MSLPSLAEHADLLLVIIGFLFVSHIAVLFWLLRKYSTIIDRHEKVLPAIVSSLEKIDKNQNDLFERLQSFTDYLRETENKLSELKGSHEALVAAGNPHVRKTSA